MLCNNMLLIQTSSFQSNIASLTIDVKNVQKKNKKTLKNVKKRNKNKKRLKTLDKKRSSPIHNA